MIKSVCYLALVATLFSFTNPKTKKEMTINSSAEVSKLASDVMTPEVLWSFGRIGDPGVSPDGTKVLFSVTKYNIEENKSYRDLYIVPVSGGQSVRITDTAERETQALWRPDGKKIGFL